MLGLAEAGGYIWWHMLLAGEEIILLTGWCVNIY